MSEYVPTAEVRRLANLAESDAELFEEDSQAYKVGMKIAGDIEDAIEEESVAESEVCDE